MLSIPVAQGVSLLLPHKTWWLAVDRNNLKSCVEMEFVPQYFQRMIGRKNGRVFQIQ